MNMNRAERIPVIVVSAVLALYAVFILVGVQMNITWMIFVASPFLVIWLVYRVIRYGEYRGNELGEDQEWGYMDRP